MKDKMRKSAGWSSEESLPRRGGLEGCWPKGNGGFRGPDAPGERHGTVETQPKQRSGGQGCGLWRGSNVVI